MKVLSRLPRPHLAVYGAYLLAALVITWPLLTVFSTRFIGHPFGDTYEYAGLIWWFKHALQTGAPLFFQPLLAYPDGLSAAYLWSIPLQSFPAWLFALFMPLPAAFNLSILLTLALNGWSMFFLASYLTRNRAAAWVSGLVFMAYPAFEGQLAAGHIGLLQQWAAPLLIYALLRLRDTAERRWMIYGALFFVASLLGSSLNLIYVLFPVIGFLALALVFRREWKPLLRTIMTIILGGVGSLIFLAPVLLEGAASPIGLSEGGTVAFSADLLAVVSPSFQNPLFSALDYPHRVLGVDPFEKMAYVGIAAGLLTLLALWRRREARGWLLLGLFAWILSLGSILKILDSPVHRVIEGYDTLVTLPWIAAQKLPLLNISRTPARFNFTLALVVALLAGYGLSVLWDAFAKWRFQPRFQWGIVLVISAFVLYEYPFFWTNGLPDMPTLPGSVPGPIADLAGQDTIRAVFDIPWDHLLTDKEAMFLQTGHQHPIIAGHIARRTPVDPARLSLLQGTLDPALLNASGVDVVILHKQWDDAEGKTEAFTRAKLGDPFYEDENYAAFYTPKSDAAPVFTSVLSVATVVTDHTDSFIYTPAPGWVMLTQTLDADGRLATLTINGKQVYRWTVTSRTAVQAPLFLQEAGYYRVRLALDPPCPTIISPDLTCNELKVSDIAMGDLIPVDRARRDAKSVVFANGLMLNAGYVGYQGGALSVWLDWFFDSPRAETDIRFVHVLDADGKLVAQADNTLGVQAAGGGWSEAVPIALPDDLAPGEYQVDVGWYAYPDTTPFAILSDGSDAQSAQNGILEIGTFSVP